MGVVSAKCLPSACQVPASASPPLRILQPPNPGAFLPSHAPNSTPLPATSPRPATGCRRASVPPHPTPHGAAAGKPWSPSRRLGTVQGSLDSFGVAAAQAPGQRKDGGGPLRGASQNLISAGPLHLPGGIVLGLLSAFHAPSQCRAEAHPRAHGTTPLAFSSDGCISGCHSRPLRSPCVSN